MMTFFDFLENRQKMALPDAVTMLAMLGIDPQGPHEVELSRLLKRWKKWPEGPATCPLGLADPAPLSAQKEFVGRATKPKR